MDDSTRVTQSVQGCDAATVTPLRSDVILDEAAAEAQQLALLAELAPERFEGGWRIDASSSDTRLAAARHLAHGARLAGKAAEQERGRCAGTYGRSGAGVGMS